MLDNLFAQLESEGVIEAVPQSLIKDAKDKEDKALKAIKRADKAREKLLQAANGEAVEEPKVRKTATKRKSKEVVPEVVAEPVAPDAKPVYKTYEDFDYDNLLTYAGIDCIATSSVMAKLFPKIIEKPDFYIVGPNGDKITTKAPAIIESIQNIEMVAHEFILDLEITGMKYDIDRNLHFAQRMVNEVAELEETIRPYVGNINFDSGKEVAELLYGKLGFTPPFLTKSGEPSTDGDALLTLAGIDPMSFKYVAPDPKLQWLADMAKRKDINSSYNTFIRTYVEDFVKRDGRIHPSYNLHGTSSFRITGSDPNLTQLPRPKHGYNLRECYTVESGFIFIAADWSSAEVKILGALSRDPNLLNAIAKGYDFHSFSGSQMIGVPYDEFIAVLNEKGNPLAKFYKQTRQSAKALTFGILYGSSVAGIAMNLNVSKDEAERLINLYFKAYPGVLKYVQDTHRMAEWNQFVTTPFGQRKQEYGTYSVFKPTAAYNAALRNSQNVRVQSTTSTAGLITFAACSEGVKEFGARATCTVYDSEEFESPLERAAEVVERIFYYFDDWPVKEFDFLDLPIGCEVEVGLNWGQCETVHRGVTQSEIEAIIAKMKA